MKKNLEHHEKKLLATYMELYNHIYDPKDKRIYEASNGVKILEKHIEMQQIIYFLQTLKISTVYNFCWDFRGPASEALERDLKLLDEKEEAIIDFYDKYNQRRFSISEVELEKRLFNYYRKEEIAKIMNSIISLDAVLKDPKEFEILAAMIYIKNTRNPDISQEKLFNTIEKVYKKKGIEVSNELMVKVWNTLALSDIKAQNDQKIVDRKDFIRPKEDIKQKAQEHMSDTFKLHLGLSLEEFRLLSYDEQQEVLKEYHKKHPKKKSDEVHVMLGSGEHATFIKVKRGERVLINSGDHSFFIRAGETAETQEEQFERWFKSLDSYKHHKRVRSLKERIKERLKR